MDSIRIVLMQSLSTSSKVSFNADDKIGSFPSILAGPVERKVHAIADAQVQRLEIRHVNAESGVSRRGVMYGVPAVGTPVDGRRDECLDAEHFARRHGS